MQLKDFSKYYTCKYSSEIDLTKISFSLFYQNHFKVKAISNVERQESALQNDHLQQDRTLAIRNKETIFKTYKV